MSPSQVMLSHTLLLLLSMLCVCGSGIQQQQQQQQQQFSPQIVINSSGSTPQAHFIHGGNPEGPKPSSGTQTPIYSSNPNNIIATTSRSKLWAPYSTVGGQFAVEEPEDEFPQSRKPKLLSSEFTSPARIEKGVPGDLNNAKDGDNENSDEARQASFHKLPVISSIRHFRSRKSFVRIRKGGGNNSITVVSSTTMRSINASDEEEMQGDAPDHNYLTSINKALGPSSSSPSSTSYGKVVVGSTNLSGGRKTSNSSYDDSGTGGAVYGIPYFTPPPANTSAAGTSVNQNSTSAKTNLKKINKALLLPKRARNNFTDSGEILEKPKVGLRSESNVESGVDQSFTTTTKRPPKSGKKFRNGTKRPKEAGPVSVDDTSISESTGGGRVPVGIGSRRQPNDHLQHQQQAFRKVNEKPRPPAKTDFRAPHYDQQVLSQEETETISPSADYTSGFFNGNNDDPSYEGDSSNKGPPMSYIVEEGDYGVGVVELGDSASSGDTPSATRSSIDEVKPEIDIVRAFLNIVESQHLLGDNCTRGTEYNLGEGVVDRYAQERFRLEAELTVNRANMLTRFWKYADPKSLNDEYILHAMVISLVEFDEDIFAGGNCYDANQYKNYTLFCPFGYREKDGSILVKDLSQEYQYLSNGSEWFYKARKDAERIVRNYNQIRKGYHSFRKNESVLVEDEILNVTYDDGKWSKPYFDCGGGNIWMMTYTVPFFGYNGTYYFKGTSGIDIDLRRVDIDQCPLPPNSTELNIFADSHKCKKATTKCVPLKGLGFRRGSYKCECKDGFYFPNVSSPFKYFNGTLLEEEFEKKATLNETSLYDVDGMFECLLCPEGCDTCEDDRPCVVSLNWLMRTAILILQCAIIAMLPIVGLFTWKYSNVKVVRAASPVLLRFIVLGAFFIYCTILVMYPSPNVITCTIRVWLREIGFSLAYGALMLKTWRISVIFRVRSAKAIKITDLDLMKRLGIIVAVFTSLLVIRTLVAPPIAIVTYTADELKAWLCKTDWWDHSFTIMELSFLVWGIRLCIVVRKAPSEFNESKFISLAIYNEFLLSLFLNISMLFLQSPANPDLLYIIFFCHVQLTMTLLLCLIFGSKAYIVFRGQGKGGSAGGEDLRAPTSKFISKNRSGGGGAAKQPSAHNSTGLHSSTTSTSHDPNLNNSRLSEDVQEEFRRLYFQLEELKERNMRLGNRHLVAKITAMQEAADNIFSTTAQINGQQVQSDQSFQDAGGGNANKGKICSGTLTDISEEDNPPLASTTGGSPKRSVPSKDKLSDNKNISDRKNDGHVSEGESSLDSSKNKMEVQDTNLDDVDDVEDSGTTDTKKSTNKLGVTFDLGGSSEVESIGMKNLSSSGEKRAASKSHKTPAKGEKSSKAKDETGANHAGNAKLVLDLDDKSRFTEEITV